MKKSVLMGLVVVAAWALMAVVVRRLVPDDPRDDAAAEAPRPPGDEIASSRALRDQLLHATWQEIGIRPQQGVWGVLMELGFAKGVATVVALVDGTASLYVSTGATALGGHAHEKARAAALKLCETAAATATETTVTTTFPQPSAGQVRFYVLTDAGVRTAETDERSLASGKSPLSPLYAGGQAVIAGLREATGLGTTAGPP